MQVGLELDLKVATTLMGWKYEGYGVWDTPDGKQPFSNLPNYSINITDAWEVVEKMLELGYDFRLEKIYGEYQCLFDKAICQWNEGGEYAETAPLAICLAALKVFGVES